MDQNTAFERGSACGNVDMNSLFRIIIEWSPRGCITAFISVVKRGVCSMYCRIGLFCQIDI